MSKFTINKIDFVSEDKILIQTINKIQVLAQTSFFQCSDRPALMDKLNLTNFINKEEFNSEEWACLENQTFQILGIKMLSNYFSIDLIILKSSSL